MLERKLYKTKLCVLYQRGHCARQSCSFAHGDTELRGSFNGRRYHRDGDLRDTIERRRSPERRYSPGRDARVRRPHHGHSPSKSLEKRSNRKRRKKQLLDGQSDFSGSLKISDGTDDRKEGNMISSGSKNVLLDQLKQVQSDINMMDHHKCQLELDLEERVQEVDSLTSRIHDLEAQLYKEKDDCKRLTSKIKKFLKAHNRHLQIQDELKRSQAQLRKLGDQLGSDTTKPGVLDEDLSINIVSDEETTGNLGPQNMLEKSAAPSKKRSRMNLNAAEEATPWVNLTNEDGDLAETIRSKKPSRWNVDHAQINTEMVAGEVNNGAKPNEVNRKGVKNVSTSSRSADKLKVLDSGFVLPSTSMAAHAVDEVAETIEEEKVKVLQNASKEVEKGAVYEFNGVSFPLPPPPPLPPLSKNAYSQYKGDDENVDVEGHEEEMEEVDIV